MSLDAYGDYGHKQNQSDFDFDERHCIINDISLHMSLDAYGHKQNQSDLGF